MTVVMGAGAKKIPACAGMTVLARVSPNANWYYLKESGDGGAQGFDA
jgi:hypothetical protein